MHIQEKMKLMHQNQVINWHEHVWFSSSQDHTLNAARFDSKMAVYDQLGFDKIVVSLPIANPKRCPTELFQTANQVVHSAMSRFPGKVFGMAYVHAGHIKDALYEIDKCVQDLGMVGVKLYCDYFMDDPVQDPIIEKCIDLDVPILMHGARCMDPGNQIRQPLCSTGVHMANAAKRYPEATFLMGHFPITDWEYQLKAIAPYRNIYTDMSGSAYDSPQMEYAVDALGADRILFGSDGYPVACVGKILGANISEQDKKTILGSFAFDKYLERAGR